jgi:hypothetical protein
MRFDVHTWSLACPHLLPFLAPVPTLQEDVSHGLRSVVALALVGVSFVDCVQVCSEADLACTHLCDHRADRPMCANMGVEGRLSWPYPKFEKLSSMPGRFPGSFPHASHRLTDGGFRGCC